MLHRASSQCPLHVMGNILGDNNVSLNHLCADLGRERVIFVLTVRLVAIPAHMASDNN